MTKRSHLFCLAGLLLVIGTYNCLKFLGYPPVVFPDESTYISSIFRQHYSESGIPNYLYYLAYSLTGLFGDGFLDAARVMNGLMYTLSGPFIYAIARFVCTPRLSLLITGISLLLPYSWYTAFFIPEGPYFTCFWIWAWLLLRYRTIAPWKQGALTGAILGITSLIKVHAVFLLPAYSLFLVLTTPSGWRVKNSLPPVAVSAAVCLAVKLSLGGLLAGTNGLTIFGSDYNTLADTGMEGMSLTALLQLASINMLGQLLVLLFFFGLIIAAAVYCIASIQAGEVDPHVAVTRDLAVLTVSVVVTMGAVTMAFHANVTQFIRDNLFEEWEIVQTRYYSFIFPGFVILAGYLHQVHGRLNYPKWLSWIWGGMAALAVANFMTNFFGFVIYSYLCPEVAFPFRYWPSLLSLAVTIFAALPCLLALRSMRRGITAFLAVMALYSAYFSVTSVYTYRDLMHVWDPYTASGLYLKDYLGQEIHSLTVIDTSEHRGSKTVFFTDASDVQYVKRLLPGSVVPRETFQPGCKWVFSIGNVTIPDEDKKAVIEPVPDMYKCQLIRIAPFSFTADLVRDEVSWPVRSVREEDGWIVVTYAIPLPTSMRVKLEMPPGTSNVHYSLTVEGLPRPVELDPVKDGMGRLVMVKNPGTTLRLRTNSDGVEMPWPERIEIIPRTAHPIYEAWKDCPAALPIDWKPVLVR